MERVEESMQTMQGLVFNNQLDLPRQIGGAIRGLEDTIAIQRPLPNRICDYANMTQQGCGKHLRTRKSSA